MKGYTLISAKADKDSGISIVRIGTDMGHFEGIAECMIEDLPQFSNYFGCRLAELRANEKYAKAKVKHYRARLEALESFEKTMRGTRNWNERDFYVKQLHGHINKTTIMVNCWKRIVATRQNQIKTAIQERDELITKLGDKADDSIYG